MKRNLGVYLISQTEVNGYDTFDSAVVIAESRNEARQIHPTSTYGYDNPWESDMWAPSPTLVQVKLIGVASPELEEGEIICASFNAG